MSYNEKLTTGQERILVIGGGSGGCRSFPSGGAGGGVGKLLGLVIYDVEVAWGWTVVIMLLGGDTTAIIQCMKDTRKT